LIKILTTLKRGEILKDNVSRLFPMPDEPSPQVARADADDGEVQRQVLDAIWDSGPFRKAKAEANQMAGLRMPGNWRQT
jgi:hypothetical protein